MIVTIPTDRISVGVAGNFLISGGGLDVREENVR